MEVLHLRTSDLCGINPQGGIIRRLHNVPTNPVALRKAVSVFPQPLTIVIEESAIAQRLFEILSPLASRVIVVDPRINRLISEAKAKSDPIDAYKLAELFRIGAVSHVFHSLDPDRVAFRRAVQQYLSLTREMVKFKNRIRKSYNQFTLDPPAADIYHPKRRESLLAPLPVFDQTRLRAWYSVLDELIDARNQTYRLVLRLGRPLEEVRLFRGVPGIGFQTACELSAYIQNPFRFQHKSQICSYARLAVVDRSSAGKLLGRRHLSRQGIGVLKAATRRAFIGAFRRNCGDNAVVHFYQNLRKHCLNPVHARLTTQRKILITVWAMWKRKEVFNPNRFLSTDTQRV